MKTCLQCKTEMKLISNKGMFLKEIIKFQGDGFLWRDSYDNVYAEVYICPKCRMIQQYVPEEYLDKM